MTSAARSRRWRDSNPGRVRMANRKHNRANQLAMRAFAKEQKNRPCADCGGSFPTVCMDFDHRPGEIKVAEISMFTGGWDALKREIAKCDVVCANCHRIRTTKRGQWGSRRAEVDTPAPPKQLALLPEEG